MEEGDNSPADLFFSQDAGALGALEKEGRLTQLPGDVLDEVDSRYRSRDGRWVATSARARVVAYNRDRVNRSELRGRSSASRTSAGRARIGWAPTNGSFQAFVTALRKLEGEDAAREWLEGIVANDPEVFDDNEPIRDALGKGELDVGFINHYYVAQARAKEGADYPVEVVLPAGRRPGVARERGRASAILESSDQQEEAEHFTRVHALARGPGAFRRDVKEYPVAAGVAGGPAVGAAGAHPAAGHRPLQPRRPARDAGADPGVRSAVIVTTAHAHGAPRAGLVVGAVAVAIPVALPLAYLA